MVRSCLLAGLCLLVVACGDDERRGPAGEDAGAVEETDSGPVACLMQSAECTTPGGDECCEGLVCRASSSSAFCVEPDDTCFVGPDEGCCLDDADCEGDARCHAMECRPGGEGVCKEPVAEGCWSDRDCPGGSCEGVTLCPCGTSCVVPDEPGTCT